MSKLSLPDSIVLNEVRIPKRNLVSIPVRKCYFAPNNRRAIGKIIRERELVAVFSGQNIVYLAKTKQNTKLSEDIGLDIRDEIKTFSDLPEEIARQFVFALIQKVIEKQGLFRGDGFQFVSFQEKFPNGFKAFDLDIRDNPDHYSIFIDPTILVMLPISKFPKENLKQGRLFMKVITPNNKEKIREWKHSPYSGRAGFFEKFDNAEIISSPDGLNENDVVLVRRTSSSDDLVPYPAFAIRVIAKRDEIEALSLSVKERRMYQPLSKIRLSETKRWINQIFSGGTLSINDRSIQIEDMTSSFKKMETYRVGVSHSNIWYPETPLMFDPLGTKNTPFQLIGLRNYGPFDKNARSRSFTSIKPYLIIPNNPELIELSNELFQYLSNGYTKRINTDFGDIDFDGLGKHFYIDFVPPSPLDTTIIDSGSIEEYVQAANDLLIRWAGQDARDENRIAIVVVPNRYEDEDEGDDPYVDLKKIFIQDGLPSQMIQEAKLLDIRKSAVAYGHILWHFALSLYVKMGGKPWALARQINNVNCLIGIGFGKAKQEKNSIYVGIANIFDSHGQWLSFTSEDKELNAEEVASLENREFGVAATSSYKLHKDLTYKIAKGSLSAYVQSSTSAIPTMVVLHKNGKMYESEALGFLQALSESVLDGGQKLSSTKFALVSIIKNHDLRVYGPDNINESLPIQNTVSRGAVHLINENTAVVATTGKNQSYYPGIGTPRPLILERFCPSDETLKVAGFDKAQMYSIEEICDQVLSLTKLHWGTTRSIRLPITSEYAQRIARFVARSRVRVELLLKLKKLWWV